MSILAECLCHRKQAISRKRCPKCGADMDKLKKGKSVRYHIAYRVNGVQKRVSVASVKGMDPFSIEDAHKVEAKHTVAKEERKLEIFDRKKEDLMTFKELSDWHLNLEHVKGKPYYPTLKINLQNFNSELGGAVVKDIQVLDIQNYQAKRKKAGYSDSYIDQEVTAAKTVINNAFENGLISGDPVRVFKKVKKLLKRNANARDRILKPDEFRRLMDALPEHTKQILATAFYTGMRRGEILGLTWNKVDMRDRVIRLEAAVTKDGEPRSIPIADPLFEILKAIPGKITGSAKNRYVFTFRGEPIRDLRTALKGACKKAGIKYGRFEKGGFVFRDLRHTFNTYMRKAGIQESVIMAITGHNTREMFDRYNTVDREDTRQAVDQTVDHRARTKRIRLRKSKHCKA